MSKRERGQSTDEDTLQHALLEAIRQNGRLLDELQAARRREDDLIDRLMQLEEELRGHYSTGTKPTTKHHTSFNEAQEDQEDEQTVGSELDRPKEEELKEWDRVPHYEIIVNGTTKSEGFVANNSCVCFIRPEVVKRAKLQPYKVNPPARFRFFGVEGQVVVKEAVMVPMQMGKYSGKYPMFICEVRSEIILGANWLQNERVYWALDYMLVGPKKIRVDPKPPIRIKENDPRALVLEGPVIIERLT